MNIKSMTKADLLEQRAANLEERSQITNGGKGDTTLTAEQVSRLEEIRSSNALIDAELERRADAEAKALRYAPPSKPRKQATMTQVLRALAGMGEHTDEVEEVLQRGREQMAGVRGVSCNGVALPIDFRAAGTATVMATKEPGKSLVGEQAYLLEADTQDLVFAKAGANIITGLTDNLKISEGDLPQAVWEDEVAPIKEADMTLNTTTLAPKRLGIVVSVSKQMLVQDTVGINRWLSDLMVAKIYESLEQAFLSSTSVAKAPKSLFDASAYPGIKSIGASEAVSYAGLVKMQAILAGNNELKGRLGYIGTPILQTTLKTVPRDPKQSLGFVLNDSDGMVAGYPIYSTSLATAESGENVLFANWSNLMIGQWGALDLTVDPYTLADQGKVRMVINSYWDGAPIKQGAFAKASMTLDASTTSTTGK